MTRNKAVRMPLVVLLLASMMVLGTDRADAHPAILWYPFWWKATPTVPFYWADPDFNDGAVPGAAGRARIGNDHAEWNKLNQSMRFADGGFNYSLSPNDCNGEDQNGIYWYDIADPAGENRLAEVQACVFSNDQTTYWSYQMSFDSQDPWYAGTGTPGLGQNDLWGVAAHEAGHAAGHWYHWDESGYPDLCLPTAPHTMCSSIFLNGQAERSLESHDRHTFEETY